MTTTTSPDNKIIFRIVGFEPKSEAPAAPIVAEAPAPTVRETPKKIEVGTILVSSWGYDQTNRDFYQVTKRTATTATVREIKQTSIYTMQDQGEAMPIPGEFVGGEIRRKIYDYGSGEHIAIASFARARIWNGKPQHFTEYA